MNKIKYYNNSYDFYNPSSPCISTYQSIDFIKSKILVSHMLFYWHKKIIQKQQTGWMKKEKKVLLQDKQPL